MSKLATNSTGNRSTRTQFGEESSRTGDEMMMMNRMILALVLAATVAVAWGATVHGAQASKPNMVFLLADDVNRDTWGAYGGKNCKTPNIDQLATEGMRFDRAYCSVAMCAPFRQELYSGRTPWRTGTLPNHSKSIPGTRSIPHYLQPLGYRIALIGKYHVGPDEAYPFERLDAPRVKGGGKNASLVQGAMAFIDSCKEEGKPFCVFICSSDSHAPFTSGDRSIYNADDFTVPPYWLDTPTLREVLVKYYAEITNFDALVGQTRKQLEERGVWSNTIFMVCGEQGGSAALCKMDVLRQRTSHGPGGALAGSHQTRLRGRRADFHGGYHSHIR